jgi:hypothetical protein
MPTHERLRTNDRKNVQDRRKPSIQLDKEPAIIVAEPHLHVALPAQDNELMSERRVLCFKSAPRL